MKFQIKKFPVSVYENSMVIDANDSYKRSVSSLPSVDQERNIDKNLEMVNLERENVANDKPSGEDGEENVAGGADSVGGNDAGSISDISELVEERLEQLESERISKRAEKNSRATMKPLELAEALEKKQASTGLHWEEGAAAQPMQLEGVRRISTTLGYFDVEANNSITQTLSSQAFRRDHGSPQVLAVHLNFIAVGMTKRVIILVPSKYYAHHADNMDPKMVILGLQGDRSLAPVTSMCFKHPGDLLLAGYGDGHVTVWDVQRASAAKVITGEHTAPVIHTLFLGQDSQVTRQFKAVTGDSKGLVLLHAFSVVTLLNRFSIKTQCLLDGQRTGTVLSASPLLFDYSCGSTLVASQGNATFSTSSIGSKMGGVVGGDAGWKLFAEGSSLVEEGVVLFVTYQTALVIRLTPSLEVYAQLTRPDGVREGSMPYTSWTCITQPRGSSSDEVFSYISVAFCNQIDKMEQPDDPGSRNSSVHSEIKEQFSRVGGVAVEFCVHIKRTDILFDEIFSKFMAIQQRDITHSSFYGCNSYFHILYFPFNIKVEIHIAKSDINDVE
ncbi:hypothetical protein CRYUN_Cryun23aG0121200 [Craigia yunnanensis]